MKNAFWISGAVAIGIWLAPVTQAQETSPATGTAHAAKAPRSGASSIFSLPGSTATNGMTNGMVITSARMELDYKETNAMVVAFDENVHVVDPRYDVTCDRMLIFLEGSNQIKRILAIGNVNISQPDRHATCEKADFLNATGEIVLTGNPVVTSGANRSEAEKITIYQNDSRVVMEGNFHANLSTDPTKKTEKKQPKQDEKKP